MTTLAWEDVVLEEWLASLLAQTTTPASRSVLGVLMQQPERASQASSQWIADTAGVNIASVTRAAQALGFDGWSNLRDELRTRLVTALARKGTSTSHRESPPKTAMAKSLDMDLRTTMRTADALDQDAIVAAVDDFANATTRLVVGAGNAAHIAQLWSSIASLAGYPSIAPSEGSPLVNAVAQLGPADMVVALGFWRLYDSTIVAAEGARSRGAKVCVVTDQSPSPLTDTADHVIRLSAEGGSFFPSLASAMFLVNAFCAELADVHPARTNDSLRLAEVEWNRSGLLRRPDGASR